MYDLVGIQVGGQILFEREKKAAFAPLQDNGVLQPGPLADRWVAYLKGNLRGLRILEVPDTLNY